MAPLLIVLTLLGSCCYPSSAQRAQRLMVGIHTDLIKTDNDGFFEKAQGGVEAGFYMSRKFAVTGALEWWSPDEVVAIAGARFCPIDEAFIRGRALFGRDFSLGGGFVKPLRENLRIEAMADFYGSGDIAIRAGLALGFGGRP